MRKWFWLIVSAALLALSYAVTSSGMIGGWDVQVLGVRHGSIWDPGGPYLGGGLLLFDYGYAPFIGHPGLTLSLLCYVVGQIMYWPFSGDMTFSDFAARHIHWITFGAMMVMSGTWLATLVVVERVAMRLLQNPRLAMLAVVAYATTFPVLYYVNKISPESLLVLFTLLSFLALWRFYESDGTRALVFLALAAQASVAALYTKFLIVGPIVPFIAVHLLFAGGASLQRRVRNAALYVVFCVPALWLGALKTDWEYFFQFWFAYAPGAPRYAASSSWVTNVFVNAPNTAFAMIGSALSQLAPWRLMPSFETKEGLFLAAEGLFILLSIAGAFLYLRGFRSRPVLVNWFLAFLAMTSIPFLQRGWGGWHYLFIHFAVGSIFVSYLLARVVQRAAGASVATARGWALACGLVLAVNGVGAYLFVQMRQFDARQYKEWGLYYRAPSLVAPGGRIGLVRARHIDDILQPVAAYVPREGFLTALHELYVPVRGDEGAAELKRRNIQGVVESTPNGLVFTKVN